MFIIIWQIKKFLHFFLYKTKFVIQFFTITSLQNSFGYCTFKISMLMTFVMIG